MTYPEKIQSVEQLEEMLSSPTPAAVDAMKRVSGDIVILGVAGKMGPTLARMVVRASDAAGVKRRVIGVSRFSNPDEEKKLQAFGVETIKADLLDPEQLRRAPDAPNVIYMAARKFGSTGDEPMTWAMNAVLPGMVAQRYGKSRIAAFSTGNVYPLVPITGGGCVETDRPGPVGEYAMSCLGRERAFEYYSKTHGTPLSIMRLNYACELRYGVLVDIARKVWQGEEIDLSMGAFNVIWQGDANAMSIASLADTVSPPFIVNVAGPEILSVRKVCEQFGAMMQRPPKFIGAEKGDALISNGTLGHRRYGRPTVTAERMMGWIAAWVMSGGASLNKPTHFETRDGKY